MNFYFTAGIAYIAFCVGLCAAKTGETLPKSEDPVSWTLPFLLALMMGLPFVLGYFAAKGEK